MLRKYDRNAGQLELGLKEPSVRTHPPHSRQSPDTKYFVYDPRLVSNQDLIAKLTEKVKNFRRNPPNGYDFASVEHAYDLARQVDAFHWSKIPQIETSYAGYRHQVHAQILTDLDKIETESGMESVLGFLFYFAHKPSTMPDTAARTKLEGELTRIFRDRPGFRDALAAFMKENLAA